MSLNRSGDASQSPRPRAAKARVRRKPATPAGRGALGAVARQTQQTRPRVIRAQPPRRAPSSSPLRGPLAVPPSLARGQAPHRPAGRGRVVAHGSAKVSVGKPRTFRVGTHDQGGLGGLLHDVSSTVDRELSGEGVIAKSVGKFAKKVGEGGVVVSTGGGPVVGPGSIGGKRGPVASALAPKALRLKDAPGARRFVEDIVNLPAVAIPSVYVPLAAAAEAAVGHPARGKKLLHDLPRTDPVAALVTGHPKRALKLAEEHPGFAAVEALGVKGVAGRGAGRTVRGTGKVVRAAGRTAHKPRVALAGEAIRQVGAVETRPNARVPGTALVQDRQYSPDLSNKAVQIVRDRRGAKAAVKLRAKAARNPDPDTALRLRQRANARDPEVARPVDVRRRVNLLEQRNENTRRRDQEATDRTERSIRKQAGDKGAAPTLVAMGITRATAADLRAYRNELAAVHPTLPPAKRAANAKMRREIDVSLKVAAKRTPKDAPPPRPGAPDPAIARVLAAAKRYSAEIDQPLDRVLADMGILDAARGTRAKLIPVAAREAGATVLAKPSRVPRADASTVARAYESLAAPGPGTRLTDVRVSPAADGRTAIRARILHDGEPVGHVTRLFDERTGALTMEAVRVAPEHRAKGVAARLNAMEEAALARAGVRDVEAMPLTKAGHMVAQRVGYRPDPARPGVVRKRLTPTYGIVDREGVPMSTGAMRAVATSTRDVQPSYVSQAPNSTGAGAYYRSAAREPSVSSRARSEKPTLEGTFDATPEALRARALASTGMASAAKNFRDFISETALRDRDGGVRANLTRDQAMRLRDDIHTESGLEFVPVAVRPWAASAEHIDAMMHDIDALGDFDPRTLDSFRESLQAGLQGKGDGPFALVPAAAAKQAAKFLKIQDPTDFGRGMRALRSSFSRTVLTTSPGPTFGNIVEPAVRTLIQHGDAGPLAPLAAAVSTYRGVRVRKELRKMAPDVAAALDSVIGRGQVTLAAKRTYVDPRQFDPGAVRNLVAGWQALKRAPVGKQVVGAWDLWTKLVFEQVNGRVERYLREGPILGKVLKDSGLMDHTLMALSSKAMRQAAEGILDVSTHARLAAKLNDAYGKYQGFSPAGQKAIAEYTPFAAWWLSAATFVGKVLPRDHPALLALIASSAQATEEWRKARGLDLFQGDGKLPGWLQGTIDTGTDKGRVKAAYNTPFGAFTDPLNAAGSLFFPQGENLLKAFQGLDWKNKALRNDDGTEYDEIQKALYAVGELLKSTVPAIAVPVKVTRYTENPRALLNPILIPPAKPRVRAGRQTGLDARIDRLVNGDPVQDRLDRLLNAGAP